MIDNTSVICYGCGATVHKNDRLCKFCGNPVLITTFNSIKSMNNALINKYIDSYNKSKADNINSHAALAFCYLRIKNYDKANIHFDESLNFDLDNHELFFYAAICKLNGKKAFLAPRDKIDKAIEYLQAAITLSPSPVYYYFLAYLKYDFFNRKCYKINPDYKEEKNNALIKGISDNDIENFYELLCVEKPDEM